MKLLFLTTFVATICYVSGGKTQRMIAAMNMMAAMNGGVVNPGMLAAINGGMVNPAMLAAMNGGMVNPGMLAAMNGGMVNPGMLAGGLNRPMVAAGGAGVIGQPQFAQFVPGVPAYALPAPVPNVYPVPGVNAPSFMGVPQMAPVNPPQQPLMGNAGGAMAQQLPLQPDPLRRFRRQTMKQDNNIKTTVDTQIPAPTNLMATLSGEDDHQDK